jgi:type II secretory pathway component GspD/PulD (secretin)
VNNRKTVNWTRKPAVVAITLAMACCGMNAVAQTQAADEKAGPEVYQTLYLTNLTQQNDANELVTDLRNMLPKAKTYYVPSQSAISMRGSAEDIALAQKILSDLDKTKKINRLYLYDDGKRRVPQVAQVF